MKKIFYLLLLLIGLSSQAFSQQNLTLYNMEVVPQRMYSNPAFLPKYSRVNIGLPMLSSQYFNFSNSGFKYSDIIRHRADDSLYLDFGNMISKLATNNYLSVSYHPDILSFGFIVKTKNYFSFNITEKVDLRFRYPKNFMEFIWKGNGALLGQELNFNFGLNFTHYREYALGFAREMSDKLTIGGKVKYLYGMENVWTKESDVTLTTDPNSFDITAKSNIIINTSGVDNDSSNSNNFSNYAFKKKNNGLGVDLGGVYKYNDKFTFSASVIDLGFIKWKDNVTGYQSHNPNQSFKYQGLELNQVINKDSTNNVESTFQHVADSLSSAFKIDTVHKSYTTKLSTQFYIGANYNITKKINAGVLFYGQIFDNVLHPGVALSYNQKVGKWLNFSASYSIYNRSYNNFGLGLSLNAGPVQLFIVSDNLLGVFLPQNAKNLHVQTGINLTFGRKPLDKKKNEAPAKKEPAQVK